MADDELKRLLEEQSANIREHFDRRFEAVDEQFIEIRQRFDFVGERFDETRRHFDVVAERQDTRFAAVNEAITSLDERMQRGFAGLDERMAHESSETRSMIRLSYTE